MAMAESLRERVEPPALERKEKLPAPRTKPAVRERKDADLPHTRNAVYADGVVRFVLSPSYPIVGLSGGFERAPGRIGLIGLWTQRSTSLGTERLLAGLVDGSIDVLSLGPWPSLYLRGEAGVARASGTANAGAVSVTATEFHGALALGLRARMAVNRLEVEGALDAGWASSLTAAAEGRDPIGLDGMFVGVAVGSRFSIQ
jgi:hypothetical protein